MKRILASALFIFCVATSALSQTLLEGVSCVQGKVCRVETTLLPLRALPRPFSALYSEPSTSGNVMQDNLRSFTPLYVFDRRDLDFSDPLAPKGWYQVGVTQNQPFGWLRAADVMEWRQALMMAYTHPGDGADKRPPVLMFRELAPLKKIVSSGESDAKVAPLYGSISQGSPPDSIIASEPPGFVDIDDPDQFYVVPVVNFERVDYLDEDARFLQVAFATPGERAETDPSGAVVGGTMQDEDIVRGFNTERTGGTGADVRNLSMDIVFLLDMTSSMTPSMNALRAGLADMATTLEAQHPGRIRFGLVGFRDDLKVNPGLEFVTRNFTPTLADAETVAQLLQSSAQAAKVGSDDYAEEVFAGVEAALDSAWRADSEVRIIALIGDASGHDATHPQSTTGKVEEELRQDADQRQISMAVLHLQEDRAREDWREAEDQFTILATNAPGSVAYRAVPAGNASQIQAQLDAMAQKWSALLSDAKSGNTAGVENAAKASQPSFGTGQTSAEEEGLAGAVQQAIANQLVAFLGSETDPPRDFTAWVFDWDLNDITRPALDVRLMATRAQVSDMAEALGTILDAAETKDVLQFTFFEALQGLAAQASGGQDVTSDSAAALGRSGFLPRWLEGLPYRSDIAEMSADEFEEMSGQQRDALVDRLTSKRNYLTDLLENTDAWIQIDDRITDAKQQVTALSLEALP